MKLYRCCVLGLSLLLPVAALADFQYQETTQITGGSLLGLMKMAGHFSRQAKQAGEPIVSSVYLQGNRMARVSPETIEIIDLDKETITNIDLQKHTYTEMTFEQMRQQMEQAVEQAKEKQAEQKTSTPSQPQQPNNVDVKFIVNVRNTGTTKQVSGLNTSESILTMQMEGTDKTNGQKGAFAMTNDMWLAPEIPGYDEMREFSKKLAVKLGTAFTGSGMGSLMAMQPGMSQGMSDMVKEVSKLKGVPIEQVMRIGATANGEPLPAASEAPLPPSSSGPEMPSVGDVTKNAASAEATSRLGSFGGFGHTAASGVARNSAAQTVAGALGGFHGFGHKKKQEPPPPAAPANTPTTQETQTASVLMESKTELGSFSSAPIDSSKFSVPSGFRQVQPRQMK
jgi:hypothetical protein